jgi:hypothetical protein
MKVKHHGRRTASGRGPKIPKPNGPCRWRAEEDALLRTMPNRELARRLHRTVLAVEMRRRKLGIPKPASVRKV